MKSAKSLKLFLFFIYVFALANSPLIALALLYYERFSLQFCLETFCWIMEMWAFSNAFLSDPWWVFLIVTVLVTGYEIAVLFLPAYLWHKKRTVFHAWLIAIAGFLMPPYFYVFMLKGPDVFFPVAILMTVGYGAAWLIERGARAWGKNAEKGIQ